MREYHPSMIRRIERKLAAIDLGEWEPIRRDLESAAWDNIADVPMIEAPAVAVNTVLAMLDAPADFPWMEEALADANRREEMYANSAA